MPERIHCDICHQPIDVHASYVVRMEVFAHPTIPEMSKAELHATDFDEVLDDLLDQMKEMTADELQDAVHRKFEFRLCAACHQRFLANPLGKPRRNWVGEN